MNKIDYSDYEESIQAFWMCSLKNDFKKFNFIDALEPMQEEITRKLNEHGLGSFEDYKDQEDAIYDYDCLEQLEQKTDYIQISKEDLKEVIMKYKFDRNKDAFEDYPSFKDLKELLNRLELKEHLNQPDLISLFDAVIHAEHETGQILDITPIDELRAEFDKDMAKVE